MVIVIKFACARRSLSCDLENRRHNHCLTGARLKLSAWADSPFCALWPHISSRLFHDDRLAGHQSSSNLNLRIPREKKCTSYSGRHLRLGSQQEAREEDSRARQTVADKAAISLVWPSVCLLGSKHWNCLGEGMHSHD